MPYLIMSPVITPSSPNSRSCRQGFHKNHPQKHLTSPSWIERLNHASKTCKHLHINNPQYSPYEGRSDSFADSHHIATQSVLETSGNSLRSISSLNFASSSFCQHWFFLTCSWNVRRFWAPMCRLEYLSILCQFFTNITVSNWSVWRWLPCKVQWVASQWKKCTLFWFGARMPRACLAKYTMVGSLCCSTHH